MLLGAAVVGMVVPGVAAAALPTGCTQAGSLVTCTYGFTGAEQAFVVPGGVTSVHLTATGAAGGASRDGNVVSRAAQVDGQLAGLTAGQTLYVLVGGVPTAGGCFLTVTCTPGFNGGGRGSIFSGGGGGGGASDVRTVSSATGPASLASRLVVAGGGGGGASTAEGSSETGNPGGLGVGADAPSFAGAGGGGLYGGGSGASTVTRGNKDLVASGGGGGGSSLVPAGGGMTIVTEPASVRITYSVAPVASAIAVTSGGGQPAQTGTPFAQPLVATVTDATNAAVPGATVTFTVASGSAAFPGGATATATTDAQGRATAPALTAGSTAGPVTVTATTAGVPAAATFTATVTPAPPRADLSATLTAPATALVGVPFTATLTVRNAGPDAATGVVSGVQVPAGMRITSSGSGYLQSSGRQDGFLATAPLAPGAQLTYTIQITADPAARGVRSIAGAVTTSPPIEDPVPADNASVATITVR